MTDELTIDSPEPSSAALVAAENLPLAAEIERLLGNRNRSLGNLFLAERAFFYLNILYQLLLFRRDHELEPLYEDVFDAVRDFHGGTAADALYSAEQFRQDMDQLVAWQLLDQRLEVERLRGYRDTRKRKFRYSLPADSLALLEWLEERAREDSEADEEDTRDVLEEICGVLKDLTRMLNRHGTGRAQEDDPRRILYLLLRLDELTLQVNRHLGTFNARLLAFVIRGYQTGEARAILRELEFFVDRFLRRIHQLRAEIMAGLDTLVQSRNQEKLTQCAQAMESERRRAPGLLRRSGNYQAQARIPFGLLLFYQDGGKLDQICRRVNDSAMRVWRKLHAHLREIERRNTRVEDLRERILEIASLETDFVPHAFLRELIAAGAVTADPNYWDDSVQAMPPEPRLTSGPERIREIPPLRHKQRGTGPVVSMDEKRLQELRQWALRTLPPLTDTGARVSQGAFEEDADAGKVMELAKAGLLGNGSRLQKVELMLEAQSGSPVEVQFAEAIMRFREMLLKKKRKYSVNHVPGNAVSPERPGAEADTAAFAR